MAPKKGGGKRKGPQPSPAVGGKKQKQPNIAAALAGAAQRAAAAPDLVHLEAARPQPPLLDRRLQQDIDNRVEKYKQVWADKCEKIEIAAREAGRTAAQARRAAEAAQAGGAGGREKERDEVELDPHALNLLEDIQRGLQQGAAAGAALDRSTLEALALLCRSDCVHAHPGPSRQAYALLRSQLVQHPYASLALIAEDEAGGAYAGQPRVLICEDCAWMPMFFSADSFTGKHLLVPEVEVGGHAYKLAQLGRGERQARRVDKFPSAFHMLLHMFKAAEQSEDLDLNGDLMLLHYLLLVLQQDLRCRLEAFAGWADCEEALQPRRNALLNNSLLWRICTDMLVSEREQQEMVRLLVRLVVSTGGDSQLMEVADSEEDEKEEGGAQDDITQLAARLTRQQQDMAAFACIFSRRELAALAAQFLNMQLELFGTAEGAGMFLAHARSRTADRNFRMQLEERMQKCFWGDASECKTDDMSRALLAALAPRDRLRFIGLLVAAKFSRTWEGDHPARQALPGLVQAANLVVNGKEAEGFVEVDALQVVKSVNLDLARAIKVYSNINLLTVLVTGVALGVHAMLALGGPHSLTCLQDGAAGLPVLRQELQAALKGIAERSREPLAANRLSPSSAYDLVHAQMALAALAA